MPRDRAIGRQRTTAAVLALALLAGPGCLGPVLRPVAWTARTTTRAAVKSVVFVTKGTARLTYKTCRACARGIHGLFVHDHPPAESAASTLFTGPTPAFSADEEAPLIILGEDEE